MTGAVQDAVHLGQQRPRCSTPDPDRHPLAGPRRIGRLGPTWRLRFLRLDRQGSHRQHARGGSLAPRIHPRAENAEHENGKPAVQSAAAGAAVVAAYEAGLKSSSWHELRSMAIGALIAIAQDVVSHAIPPVMNYLIGKRGGAQSGPPAASQASAFTPTTMENH